MTLPFARGLVPIAFGPNSEWCGHNPNACVVSVETHGRHIIAKNKSGTELIRIDVVRGVPTVLARAPEYKALAANVERYLKRYADNKGPGPMRRR